MNFDYAKDSKEQRPYEHYLAAYKELDPKEISERTGFPYDEETQTFTVHLMGSTYLVSFPDYEIRHVEDSIGVYPLDDAMNAKILIIRFMAERHTALSTGKFITYHDVPWGEVYFRQFQGRCLMRFAFSYGNKLEQFQKVMNHIIGRAMEENSEKLSQDISYLVHDKLMKEMEYLMRVSDEREEERFKRLDESIRACQRDGQGRAEAAASVSVFPFLHRLKKKKFGRNGNKL